MLLVLLGQLDDVLVSEAPDKIGFDDRREHGETVLHIREIVESVDVDTSDLDFISRSGSVNHVVKDVDLLLSGDSSRGDGSRCLLDGHLLIVPVHRVYLIHSEGPSTLTYHTPAEELFPFLSVRVIDRTLDIPAAASVEDLRVLREDPCSLGDNTTDLDK